MPIESLLERIAQALETIAGELKTRKTQPVTPEPPRTILVPKNPEKPDPFNGARYVTLKQAGPLLGMSGDGLRRAITRGDLPKDIITRIGRRRIRVDLRKLEAVLEGR